MWKKLLFFGVAVALMGCGDDDRGRRGDGGGGGDTSIPSDSSVTDGNDRDWNIPDGVSPDEETCTKMDILFIIDDSGSMQEEQSNLAANFPAFITALDNFRTPGNGTIDYRLGVTTTGKDFTTEFDTSGLPIPGLFPPITEHGPHGALLQGCNMTRPWIERSDPDVSGTFSCIAQVGTGGSSMEMPLGMLEAALTDRVADGSNAGFLRDDALLAVVVLTDEDDCSSDADREVISLDITNPTGAAADACSEENLYPIMQILDTVDHVKMERGRWASAIIAGGNTDCTSSFGDAYASPRLLNFNTQVGTNAVFSSICDGDLSGALTDALSTFQAACMAFPPLE